jgi:alkaline phosphatase
MISCSEFACPRRKAMRKNTFWKWVALTLALWLLLSGCAMPTAEVIEVEKQVVVEMPVVQTVIVEREVVVEVEKKVVETVVVEADVPYKVVEIEVEKIVTATPEPEAKPRSIILLIGDGMGINQARLADLYATEVLGTGLVLNSIKTRGTTTTFAADSEVTDSAAAASAIYSGYKFNSRSLNVLPDGKNTFTIAQAAKKAGKSVGAVSTARITHATPAALFAHTADRDAENVIAEQLVEFSPQVALGGGRRHFVPQSQDGSKREDDRDLIEEMQAQGFVYVSNADELDAVDLTSTEGLLGLFSASHMAYEIDRVHVPELGAEPSIAEMTEAALGILDKNPLGFFLMVESGRIDHACHAHDAKATIEDALAFDKAIWVALEYQKTHPDVLVVVTGDHETGGMGLGIGTEYRTNVSALQSITSSLEYLDGQIKKDPTQAEELIEASFGFELTDEERAMLFEYGPELGLDVVDDPYVRAEPDVSAYIFSWAHLVLSNIESQRARIGWTSYAHTAQPVLTYAVGPGAARFGGFFDNTDIAKYMAELLNVTLELPY